VDIQYLRDRLLAIQGEVAVCAKQGREINAETTDIFKELLQDEDVREEFELCERMQLLLVFIELQNTLLAHLEKTIDESVLEHDQMVSKTTDILSTLHKR
jgi:hypothetical protein